MCWTCVKSNVLDFKVSEIKMNEKYPTNKCLNIDYVLEMVTFWIYLVK